MTMPAVAPPSLPPLPSYTLLPADVGTTATREAVGAVMEPLPGEVLGRSVPASPLTVPKDTLVPGTGGERLGLAAEPRVVCVVGWGVQV